MTSLQAAWSRLSTFNPRERRHESRSGMLLGHASIPECHQGPGSSGAGGLVVPASRPRPIQDSGRVESVLGRLPFVLLGTGILLEVAGYGFLSYNHGVLGRVFAVIGVLMCMSAFPVVVWRYRQARNAHKM